MARRNHDFQTIRSEGGLLPPDLLRRVLDPRGNLGGTKPEDYGLPQGERLNEVITQSWNRLRKHWAEFRTTAANIPESEAGTRLTNDKWSLPLLRELGFGLLPTSAGPEVGGRTYAISRFFGPVPVHLVGCGLSLDHRAAGQRGAAAANPHGLVQEFLNRSDGHLWAIVSNGLRLRVLRDNQALSRQAFLEFDLEAMFAGEVYSDFVLLWLTAHASRFLPREDGRPDTCLLERWTKEAQELGTRALGDLRGGVERALQALGEGFASHPKNMSLRDALRSGQIALPDFHGQLLRVVYRLIFLFVAEDRTLDGQPLLHPRDDSDAAKTARECYQAHYSSSRLRDLAGKIKGSRHGDLWRQFQLTVGALSGEAAFASVREHLGLPALGSFLWSPASTSALNDADLTNHDFLEAIRNLAFTRQGKVLRPVDYRNLGAEELGGVYESLLALTPQISTDGARFTFAEFAGNERKTSGSYYTPDSLVQCLLDSALDPVVEDAIRGKVGAEAEKAILALKVCDPAVGSGHFLVGAAHRLARHLARVRALAQGESEPSPLLYQHALRDVIGRCLFGVDLNPMALELCRLSLWLEALEPGKPLSFLDAHLQCGNALLGATPRLLAEGIPDEAFSPIEGDDPAICRELKRRNKRERESRQRGLFAVGGEPLLRLGDLQTELATLDSLPDDSPEAVAEKERRWKALSCSENYLITRFWADTWCAAFVAHKTKTSAAVVTEEIFRTVERDPFKAPAKLRDEVKRLATQYGFFHWHLAFPQVFRVPPQDEAPDNHLAGWSGGFDVVLGNPPWEHTELKEKEWFAQCRPDIAEASTGAERKLMIEVLRKEDPPLYASFADALREHDGASHFLGNSGRYQLCGRGRINLYAVFGEGMRHLLNDRGRVGCVLPTGIATDDTTKFFFQEVMEQKSLASLFDFENKGVFFPDVHSSYKFCLFTAERGVRPTTESTQFVFFAHAVEDLRDPKRRFTLSAKDIALLNPNTRTCPIFRSRRDAELTLAIYRRVPGLVREAQGDRPEENPWGITFKQGLFNMTSNSDLFRTREQLETAGWRLDGNIFRHDGAEYLPLYEAKMANQFDHRVAHVVISPTAVVRQGQPESLSTEEHQDPRVLPLPRYWVSAAEVQERRSGRRFFFGFTDITSPTNERSMLASIIPAAGVGHTMPLVFSSQPPPLETLFHACLNAFASDYVGRQKLGGLHYTYFIVKQLAILRPGAFAAECPWFEAADSLVAWLLPRVLELTYTAWDLEPFARDCGWSGPPFRWDEERRFLLRGEMDAAFFHLYLPATAERQWRLARVSDGAVRDETSEELAELKKHFPTPRDAVAYIMETFPIVRRKDEERFDGDYRTKRVILEIYNAMQEAIRTGQPYQTRLDPPPADPRCAHSESTRPDWAKPVVVTSHSTTSPAPALAPRLAPPRVAATAVAPELPEELVLQPEPAQRQLPLSPSKPAPRASRPTGAAPAGTWTPDPRPEVWRALAAWAKQHSYLDPATRQFGRQLADLLAANRPLHEVQLKRAYWLWHQALHLGFDPDATTAKGRKK